ncbi:MAG: hypothetical protein AABY40_04240 [Nanoarchaeota archaeon]
MSKHLSFRIIPSLDQIHRYYLEILYRERHLPTILSIFFCKDIYEKYEGKGFKLASSRTTCYNFDYNSGELEYVSYHDGDFTMPGFRWLDTRIAQFEYDKLMKDHRAKARKRVQIVYEHLLEDKAESKDPYWQEKHELFLSSLETILSIRKKD